MFDEASPVIASTGEEIAAELLPELPGQNHAAVLARINLLSVEAEMTPAVPLAPLLGELRARGLLLGVATNDIESAARAHLREAGVEPLFHQVFGADSGHGGKPGPGMLLAFLRATGLPPEQVLMVGDSAHDLVAGRAAGMRPIAVLTASPGRPSWSRWPRRCCLISGTFRPGSTPAARPEDGPAQGRTPKTT